VDTQREARWWWARALGAAGILILLAGPAFAIDLCLTGPSAPLGATGAGDAAEIEAVRPLVEAACDCAAFDGSSRASRHRAYVRCAGLPRVDRTGETLVDPNATTIVTNPILGVTLEVPPGAVRDGGEPYSGTLTISEVVDFDYDALGRVVRQSFPDLRSVSFAYDEAENLTSLIPPGRPAHGFQYDSRERESRYEPPTVGAFDPATLFTYNAESQLTRVARPDGRAVDLSYDAAGRIDLITIGRGSYDFAYDPTTGLLAQISAPGGGTLGFTYAGSLPIEILWGGEVSASVVLYSGAFACCFVILEVSSS
jgi:YD repeat-containing protein